MTSPLLDARGAVPAAPPDAAVAGHYGDPMREQRQLAETGAVVDRSNRGVLRVTGADRAGWLHSLTTQHLSDLGVGGVVEGLLLSPHGHVEHHFVAYEDGEAIWLDVEPETAPALLAFLDSMRFMLRVEVEDVTAEWGLMTVTARPAADIDVTGALVRPSVWPLGQGVDLLVPRGGLTDAVARLALPLAGMDALESLRVAARRPRLGRETDHRTIPHEVGWLETAVHLDKGCYRGQETVARVHNLGRPPRRLVFLHLDGSEETLPAHGDPVVAGDRTVGFVTSAARHYELGPVALALVKRNTPDDQPLVAGGVPAKAEAVVVA